MHEKLLKRETGLENLIKTVWKHSNFYREFWSSHGIDMAKETVSFCDIPILTKAVLTQYDPIDRCSPAFVGEYLYPTISGGTTQSPTISLISEYAVPKYFLKIKPQDVEVDSVLVLRPGIYASAFVNCIQRSGYLTPGAIVSLGDPRELTASARLAKQIRCNFLCTRASDMSSFCAALVKAEYDPRNIRLVWLAGEPITQAALTLAKKLFPEAVILGVYAMTEGPSSLGMNTADCSIVKEFGSNAYHLNTGDFYFEECEKRLIATSYVLSPTPIIRYDTGDVVNIRENVTCSCGEAGGTIAIVRGRTAKQYYKLGGFTFSTETVSSLLKSFGGLATDDFAIVLDQALIESELVTTVTIKIRPLDKNSHFLSEEITQYIKKHWIIAGKKTVANLLAENARLLFTGIVFDQDVTGQHIVTPFDES